MSRKVEQAAVSPGGAQRAFRGGASVSPLPLIESDTDILSSLAAGRSAGGAALYQTYHRTARRVLIRLLGYQSDIDDLVQDVFITAIRTSGRISRPEALKSWITSIAVFTARDEIRRRWRRRLFHLTAPDGLPEVAALSADPEMDEAVRTLYGILGQLSTDDRIAFALRFIDGMELTEVALACRVSLATIKRRLARARARFDKLAGEREELVSWIRERRR